MARVTQSVKNVAGYYKPSTWREKGMIWTSALFIVTLTVIILFLGVIWSDQPEVFDVKEVAYGQAGIDNPYKQTSDVAADEAQALITSPVAKLPEGYTTTATLINLADNLLNKKGGYITNDKLPPGIYLDNISNWEFGLLVQIRDSLQVMRNDYSRSQTQSAEDTDLIVADPKFHFDSESWILPSTESEFSDGLKALIKYRDRLTDNSAEFYARADNLADYLSAIEKRLGSLAQRLGASVATKNPTHTDEQANERAMSRTPWLKLDDVFYEARGYSWGLLHMLKAAEVDFAEILEKKNALVPLQHIIDELQNTQANIWSPIILNGTGFGFMANHSLVMASYISRANAAIIDLRQLMIQG